MSAVEFFFTRNQTEKKYKDFPQAGYAPGFSFLSEHAIVDILWSDVTTREALQVLLDLGEGSFKIEAEKAVLNHKGLLISRLFYNPNAEARLSGYHNKLSLQDDEESTRYKLRGTICTDGLVLNLLAYDTSQQKRKGKGAKVTEDEDLAAGPDMDIELDEAFLDGAYSGKADQSNIKPFDLQHINWKRGSDLLPNVEVTFHTPEVCPPADRTIVIGCDPGITNALTFSKLDPAHPQQRETFKVTGKFLNLPCVRFRHLLEQRKKEQGVTELESHIPVFERDGFDQFFQYLEECPDGNTESRLTQLWAFYEHKWFLKKRWDLRKAQTSTYDYVVQRLLRMMKGQPDQQVVLAVGLGSFTSTTGLPSKHTSIMKHVVTRVRSCFDIYLTCTSAQKLALLNWVQPRLLFDRSRALDIRWWARTSTLQVLAALDPPVRASWRQSRQDPSTVDHAKCTWIVTLLDPRTLHGSARPSLRTNDDHPSSSLRQWQQKKEKEPSASASQRQRQKEKASASASAVGASAVGASVVEASVVAGNNNWGQTTSQTICKCFMSFMYAVRFSEHS